ncbi:MAG TPA: hypothetical protein VMH80_09125 [Bryobacteraceae bacterium]|nr:hypothetical protein [Bryobacteraceae bacterium]
MILQGVALAWLCLRMWLTGLYRTYVWFFAYLLLELLQILVPFIVPINTRMYRDVFAATQFLVICGYVLVVLELYSIILRSLVGIASLSRKYIKITLGVAIVASLLTLGLQEPQNTITGYYFMFERTVVLSLAVFLLLIAGFLIYYPVPLARNAIVYLAGYAALFLAHATALFINNLGYYLTRLWGDSLMAVYTLCIAFWLFNLNEQGENSTVALGHKWSRGDEARLLAQLEAVNNTLLRTARK